MRLEHSISSTRNEKSKKKQNRIRFNGFSHVLNINGIYFYGRLFVVSFSLPCLIRSISSWASISFGLSAMDFESAYSIFPLAMSFHHIFSHIQEIFTTCVCRWCDFPFAFSLSQRCTHHFRRSALHKSSSSILQRRALNCRRAKAHVHVHEDEKD